MEKDMNKARLEFYQSGRYLEFLQRLKCYAKVLTLNEMTCYDIYPVQTIYGTLSFSLPLPPYEK